MSSHHVVREGQEYGLIITDYHPSIENRIIELLEWSPIVAVLEQSAEELLDLGLKIDLLIAPKSIKNRDYVLNEYSPLKIIETYDHEGQLFTALSYFYTQKYVDINIVGTVNPFEIVSLAKPFVYTMNIVLSNDHQRIIINNSTKFSKWYKRGEKLGFSPLKKQSCVKTTNLLPRMENELIEDEINFQVENDGLITLEINHSPFLFIEET